MVSLRAPSDLSKFETYSTRTEVLNQWITAARYKKGLNRRRKSRDLRKAAVLHLAILRAEMALKTKQCERSQRWRSLYDEEEGKSGSASIVREGATTTTTRVTTTAEGMEEKADGEGEELANLWTSELLGLDNLFNDLNQIKTAVAR